MQGEKINYVHHILNNIIKIGIAEEESSLGFFEHSKSYVVLLIEAWNLLMSKLIKFYFNYIRALSE